MLRQRVAQKWKTGDVDARIRTAGAADPSAGSEVRAAGSAAQRLSGRIHHRFDPRLKQAAANGLGQDPIQRAEAALSVAKVQLQQKDSAALTASVDRLERMLGALRGAVERGLVSPGGRGT